MCYCLCKNIKNEDSDTCDTYHLFECKEIDRSCELKRIISICKKEKLDVNGYEYIFICENVVMCKNIEEARLKLAELANKGYQICGICVSTLYKNE